MDEYLEKVAIRPQEPLFQTFRSDKPYRSPNVAPRGAQYDPAPSDRRGNLRAVSCHSFRATGITIYLENGGTLETAQKIAAHESPRTTKLYDRTNDQLTLDEIERIAI